MEELGGLLCVKNAAQLVARNPLTGLGITAGTTVASAVSLYGAWSTWIHFDRDGFSDNPLIPPVVAWMNGWLAFTVVRTVVAFLELVVGILTFFSEWYVKSQNDGKLFRWRLRWPEESLNAFATFFDMLLIMLGFFYFVVQTDCRDLNHSDKVIVGTTLITLNLIWKVVVFVVELSISLGCCGCTEPSLRDMVPKLVMNTVCCRFILWPLLIVSGIVLLSLLSILIQDTKSFKTSSIHVMRSDPHTVFFSITDLPANGTNNLTFIEALPLEPSTINGTESPENTIYCLSTFRYDSDSYEFTFNVAYIDLNASTENNLCICIPNHKVCEPHYDDLYYGHPSDGDPYRCFRRAAKLVGVDKENSPTRDRDADVHCTCDGVPLFPASTVGSSDSGNGSASASASGSGTVSGAHSSSGSGLTPQFM